MGIQTLEELHWYPMEGVQRNQVSKMSVDEVTELGEWYPMEEVQRNHLGTCMLKPPLAVSVSTARSCHANDSLSDVR